MTKVLADMPNKETMSSIYEAIADMSDHHLKVASSYEEPTIIQQQSFYTRTGEKEINQFLASHDVVKVDHTSTDYGEIITTIVYRKVIKKVDPWGDKTSEDD